jgi:hypothetical protein
LTIIWVKDKLTTTGNNMLNPFDGFTVAHGFVGFFLGRIRLNRWLFYPIPIVWEVYQLFFHYQPQGFGLGYVWLNSLVDILACAFCYEISTQYSVKYNKYLFWLKMSTDSKGIMAYFIITFGIAWLFWDDILRGGLAQQIPSPQIPLLTGSFSPVIAAFIVRTWIVRKGPVNNRSLLVWSNAGLYYLVVGFLPFVVFSLTIFLITVRDL